MPVPTRVQHEKNIWVAAGDGDLSRVQVPIPLFFGIYKLTQPPSPSRNLSNINAAISPNAPDPFTYTPMHAAASYGHLAVLAYLVSQGGDVNITDEDGDTPIYTVEDVETARWLISHGAVVDRRNNEGVSPIEHLQEDFPDIATFLQNTSSVNPAAAMTFNLQPSQHLQNAASDTLTSSLMQSVHDIMQRAEAEGTNPDEALRAAVSRTVLEGVLAGYEMSTRDDADDSNLDDQRMKRPRTDG
ncbi:hypothetical protein BDN67DRAFT_948915 [Paxillus ammoniavirescens]|nr:hypothetical protein BDN67DRAFT_948915 [Paxillus ammoniavirescens]